MKQSNKKEPEQSINQILDYAIMQSETVEHRFSFRLCSKETVACK